MRTRKSESGTRNRRTTFTALFRVPTSAFRVLLALAFAACGSSDGPRVTVTIPAGASLDAAVDSLAATHVINHPGSFRLYARLRGLAGSLKSGVYLLHQDESWSDVVAALERGRGVEQRFIVREGLRLAEVADLARAQLKIPRDSFLAAAEDSTLLTNVGLPVEAPSAEGYLFPTTYLLPLRIGARELVRVMIHQFTQQWSPEWQARLDSLHFSRHELVTLASIIESEVRYDPDRPFISAVYQNRLKRGMRLEADPTVSYAYGVPVLRGANGREAHLLGDLRRAFGRDPARQAIAARSARAAAAGSAASHTAPMTATPAAPARTSAGALAAVTPPIPITGIPGGASCASRPNPSAPSGKPASVLCAVG